MRAHYSGLSEDTPLYLRLRPGERGRWHVSELYFDGQGRPLTGAMLRRVPLAQIEAFVQEDRDDLAALVEGDRRPAVDLSALAARNVPRSGTAPAPPEPPPPLSRPVDGITDDFLRQVARAYSFAAREGRPAPTLAEQAGVPVQTVRRWIYQARKRGIIPPGRPGVAG